MSKVLFVLPFLPFPLDSGGCQALYNGIKAAVAAGSSAYLTYPDRDNSEKNRQALSEKLQGRIHILPFPAYVNKKGEKVLEVIYKSKYLLKKLIKGEIHSKAEDAPYDEWIHQLMPRNQAFCHFVNELVTQNDIDIVQCEMLDTLAFGLTLPPGVKKYFVHHELGFVRKGQHPIILQEPFAAPAHLAINKVIEIYLLNHFDAIITLSEIDTLKLREAGVSSHLHTSFATIDHLSESTLESTDGTTLSFVGPEWHPSNKQGLQWFLDSCWEQLLAANPGYQLQIIGGWSKETSQQWRSRYRHITFTGYVEDLAATIKNTIMIVPITIGSGIRMKILEAGLIGVPVVTTSIGVEGIPLVNEENCFISDSPEAFVQSVLALSDRTIRERFIRSTQQIIVARYSQDALNDNRKALYQ